MAEKLRVADRRLLTAIRDGLVTYSPGKRGGQLWQRYDNETREYKTVTGSRMSGFVMQGYVREPSRRGSGAAQITDAGRDALGEGEDG